MCSISPLGFSNVPPFEKFRNVQTLRINMVVKINNQTDTDLKLRPLLRRTIKTSVTRGEKTEGKITTL